MEAKATISEVRKGSVADQAGLQAGDVLLAINDTEVRDVIDYQVLTDEQEFKAEVVRKKNFQSQPQATSYDICKQPGEPFGLKFKTSIFDQVKTCTNQCVFCFIDQLPRNLRKNLYLKDDDFRLSFLYGNFITLTNFCDEDINRIINQRLSPLFVSLHATDPGLRKAMIKPRGKDKALAYLKSLLDAGIEVHLQIVVCPDLNDGDALLGTVEDLETNFSRVASVGVVPVGLTRYQKSPPLLRLLTPEEMGDMVKEVVSWQERLTKTKGNPWIFLADEFYLLSGRSLPPNSHYLSTGTSEHQRSYNYPQLENGIGIAALFLADVDNAVREISFSRAKKAKFTILTGKLSYSVVVEAAKKIQLASGGKISFDILAVPNDFFGQDVTVTGLLTAKDILTWLKEKDLSGRVVIPDIVLNSQGLFLDGVSWQKFVKTTPYDVEIVPSTGSGFVSKLKELAT